MDALEYFLFMILTVPYVSARETFVLTSDAPGVLDSNVTFYAKLENPDRATYTIAWQENYPNNRTLKTTLDKQHGHTSNWTLLYTEKEHRPGTYSITVIVTFQILYFNFPVASVLMEYNLTTSFPGKLIISQPGVPKANPSYISTKNETKLTALVHDPSKLLKNANVTYTWSRNNTFLANTTKPFLKTNFTQEGEYSVQVNLTAVFSPEVNETVGKVKNGSYNADIIAKVPIVNFTLEGVTWFRHGKVLRLDITCDGTPPYTYCWMIKNGPYNKTGNETCLSPSVTNDCDIPIQRYFTDSGIYTLLILMENDISHMINQTTINVYKVTRKPQVSIIAVPICCSILAVGLVIFGLSYYWDSHVRYNVEVADFDFGPVDDVPYVRFIDRLRDAISAAVHRGPRGATRLIPDNSSVVTSIEELDG